MTLTTDSLAFMTFNYIERDVVRDKHYKQKSAETCTYMSERSSSRSEHCNDCKYMPSSVQEDDGKKGEDITKSELRHLSKAEQPERNCIRESHCELNECDAVGKWICGFDECIEDVVAAAECVPEGKEKGELQNSSSARLLLCHLHSL